MNTEPTSTASNESLQLQAVLQHQEQQAQALAAVQKLQQIIAKHQEQSAALQERSKRVTEMETQREDLLADIATGQGKQTELDTLDADLAQLKRDIKEQGTQAAAEQTTTGLLRKLAKAQDEADQLRQKREGLVRALLKARAELIGAEYAQAASQVDLLCHKLRSLDSLMRQHGNHFSYGNQAVLEIPSFALASVPANKVFNRPDFLVSHARQTQGETAVFIDQEKEALRALGVQID